MPRPRTAEEMDALPIGPAFGMFLHDVSDADRARGYTLIKGRPCPVTDTQAAVRMPVAPAVIATWAEDDDIQSYCDTNGERWTLGQYADGRRFRQRS